MSYTIYLKDTNGNRINEWQDSICPTFNLATMFYKAMGISLGDMEGWEAGMTVKYLRLGLSRLQLYPEQYKQYNASNGWGTYESAVWVLEKILQMCNDNYTAILNIY